MSKNHFNTCISPLNKLNQFMSFTKDDKVLRDFIDYLTFYCSWDNKKLLSFLHRDNAPSFYLGRLSLNVMKNRVGHFLGSIDTAYNGNSLSICQLHEMKIQNKIVVKVSMYGKGLKVLREDIDLWKTLRTLFTDFLGFDDELTVVRIDYTCDCAKYNFNKYNSLRVKKGAKFLDRGRVETVYFGKRSHDSAYFIRYYDKKAEIEDHNTQWLYPEYTFIDDVMRYELSINSKGFDKTERNIHFENLYDLITLGYDIPFRDRSNEKIHRNDETILNTAIRNVNLMKNAGDFEGIDKLFIYLNELYATKNRAIPFTSDEYEGFDTLLDEI